MAKADVQRIGSQETITISSGSTVSSVFGLGHAEYVGLLTPSALNSTFFTFRIGPSSSSDASFYDLYEGATQVSLAVTTNAARTYVLDTDRPILAPFKWGVLVGSTTEDAARSLTLFTK